MPGTRPRNAWTDVSGSGSPSACTITGAFRSSTAAVAPGAMTRKRAAASARIRTAPDDDARRGSSCPGRARLPAWGGAPVPGARAEGGERYAGAASAEADAAGACAPPSRIDGGATGP